MVADSHSRPADILHSIWRCGRPAALNVHVISPLQESSPGHALNVGVRRKLAAHLVDYRAAGIDFVPIVLETLGCLSEDTIYTIRAIGETISKRASPDDFSTSTGQLFHRLTISLWRGNACLWLLRHSTPPPPVDGVI